MKYYLFRITEDNHYEPQVGIDPKGTKVCEGFDKIGDMRKIAEKMVNEGTDPGSIFYIKGNKVSLKAVVKKVVF